MKHTRAELISALVVLTFVHSMETMRTVDGSEMPDMLKTIEKKRARPNALIQPLIKRDVPPLENGDHLAQSEFHRRYETMPKSVHAELIGGIVYMASAARIEHSEPLSLATAWLVQYEAATPGVRTYCEQTLILDSEDEFQPDVALGILPQFGGSGVIQDGYLIRSPELVIEVANTTANIDLNTKLLAYQRHHTQEYIVHLAREKAVKWFVLRNNKYELQTLDRRGIIRSKVFPGLWLNVKALVQRDLRSLFKTVASGVSTPEHKAFCKRLKAKPKRIAGLHAGLVDIADDFDAPIF